MNEFVCVRVVQFWGVDLSLFQFDMNQTWTAFFLNSDRTVYGRYGSRGGKDASHDVSLAGFKKAMTAVLALHRNYPQTKKSLAGKTGPALPWRTPETMPALRGRHRKDDISQKGCIHCHNVQDAMVFSLRSDQKQVTDREIWPYPMPDIVGLKMDVREQATVQAVASGSPAERAGIKIGDRILALQGQPLLSIADIQWVLHRSPVSGKIQADVDRQGERVKVVLPLADGWRRKSSMSWRTLVWHVSRLPGFQMRTRPTNREALALSVHDVWPPGPDAQTAGITNGDVIVEIDGHDSPMNEGDFLAYLSQKKDPGETVSLTILRNGQRRKAKLVMKK